MHTMHTDFPRPPLLARAFRPDWVDVSPLVLQIEPERAELTAATAKLWSLVLASRHVPYRMRSRPMEEGGGHTVQVPAWFAGRAVEEIRLYLEENKPNEQSATLPDLRPVGDWEPTAMIMVCMVLFHWICSRVYPALGLFPEQWLDRGSSQAWAIQQGEWWRVFTGLTLHADAAHVTGNAIIGGVFVWLAARRIGSGAAWLLTVLGGGLGNAINAMALGAPHDSIGFSTAAFAAAGLLAGISRLHVPRPDSGVGHVRRVTRFLTSSLVPVAAGLGLLAMLGAGKDTDLGAHFFGFLCGLGLGASAAWAISRLGVPGKVTDTLFLATALAIPAGSWYLAWLA